MITITQSGSFNDTENYLNRMKSGEAFRALEKYGALGVQALASATPLDSGATANAWSYEVRSSQGFHSITWTNGNMVAGKPLAIMLQYGHGTGTGGYVQGRDYINPAIRPVMDQIDAEVRKVVTS